MSIILNPFPYLCTMTDFLSKEYWEERYATGETAWDMGIVSPPLKAYFDQLTNKDLSILIPGAGNSHEAEYLANAGFTNITVIDIAAAPVARIKNVLGDFIDDTCHVIQTDFFEHQGEYDLVVEQTFFCALPRSMREDYVKKMSELLSPQGKITGVMFKTEFENPGPPFGGTPDEYRKLFEPLFEIKILENCYNSHPKREKNEVFVQFVKRG